MSICLEDNCSCSHHRVLECLEKELNDEAKLALQELGNLCEMLDSSGLTLLHYSAKYGNAEMTQYLIGEGCDVNATDKSGVTPLMLAVAACREKATKVLLENNADIHATDSDGRNVLQRGFLSIDYGTQPILEMLFEKVGDDLLKGKLAQLLSNANDSAKLALVVFGDMEITEFILKTYPSIVNYHEPEGSAALHIAISYRRLDKVKVLIEHGANVDALGEENRTPLNWYATTAAEDVDENSEVLKILLRHSTTYSTPSQRDGFTDVEYLLGLGNKKTVRALLSIGVNVDSCLVKYNCVISALINNKNKDIIDLLDELDIPFDVNARYSHSPETTLVKIASQSKRPEILEFLLRHGADVNVRTPERHPALLYVLLESCDGKNNTERVKVIDLLLQYGIEIDLLFLEGDDSLQALWACMVKNFASLSSAKTVIAHVAMVTTMGHLLPDFCYSRIESVPQMKAYFDSCTKQLEDMKNCEVYGRVTLYNLCEKEEKFLAHARNREFAVAITSVMKNLPRLEPYYSRTLQRNVSTTLDVAKRQGIAPQVIEALTGLSSVAYHPIVDKIICYLSRHDVDNLCETDNIL